MSDQNGETSQRESASVQTETVDARVRTRSKTALDNAIELNRQEANDLSNALKRAIQAAQELDEESYFEDALQDLSNASQKLKTKIEDLRNLYAQNKDLGDPEALVSNELLTIELAHKTVRDLESKRKSPQWETASHKSSHSCRSRHSRRSKCLSSTVSSKSSASSAARMKALAEAAMARESAEYDRLIARKELERKTRDLEIARIQEQERAEYEQTITILAANKKVALADAKLKAIEQIIGEEEGEIRPPMFQVPEARSDDRTANWVHHTTAPAEMRQAAHQAMCLTEPADKPLNKLLTVKSETSRADPDRNLVPPMPGNVSQNELIETLTSTNQKIIAGLARQNLPKCQPDIFNGDPTIFHPWKASFKGMIADVNVSATQEINYLRSFTSGAPQKLIDNFRKRQSSDPTALLGNLWRELEHRFGSATVISKALLDRLEKSADFGEKENIKLQEFSDLCADIQSQLTHLPGLACLNYPNSIQPIASKLPQSIRRKWEREVVKQAEANGNKYPGFAVFANVIEKQSKLRNDPHILAGFKSNQPNAPTTPNKIPGNRRTLKTELKNPERHMDKKENERCLFHEREGHGLAECRAFGAMTLREKTDWIMKSKLCFRCLSAGHRASDCKKKVKCTICNDARHLALLHRDKSEPDGENNKTEKDDANIENVDTKCTSACSASQGGASCSKLVLVDVYRRRSPNNRHRVYAIIDEQSNSSLISNELADNLEANGPKEMYYLTTCTGERETRYGRRVDHILVRSLDGTTKSLPTLIECDTIPHDKREIATPEMARRFPHLREIAARIPPFDDTANVHLLIGRDAPELLKVREIKNGPTGMPWAHRLSLGWTIIGQTCLDLAGGPTHALVRHTRLSTTSLEDPIQDRYEFVACPNQVKIRETLPRPVHNLASDVFRTTREDGDIGLSHEDRKFISLMESGAHKNDLGNWEMPLPFRDQQVEMPNNRSQAENRLKGLVRTLKRKPKMESDYVEFMQRMLDKGHALPAPASETLQPGQCWYLPHFGVYHPRKPDKIRVVFDSSAEYEGVSLNNKLLAGPDLMNSLLGVLIRVRRETVAVMCDIEQMFHSFHMDPKHRNYLRFLWFKDNIPGNPIAEYKMNVHLFGNGPSPAVAAYGLRRTADEGEEKFGTEAAEFVRRNFYVDDGLTSRPTAGHAITLVTQTQAMLATANLRLHKIVSNSAEVVQAFPADDRGKAVQDLDLQHDGLPAQRSLGVEWNLQEDTFTYQVSLLDKPFTRRGVLSIVNSIYDPLGFAAPVVLEGRLLLQQLVIMAKSTKNSTPLKWDDPLPAALQSKWQRWRESLVDLEEFSIPRCYHPKGFGRISTREIHAFSDASKDAIGTVIYLHQIDKGGAVCTALVFAQSKVAPTQVTSIPRLELCAAVLAVRAVDRILKEIDLEIHEVYYYTDSKVVLSYIQNESRRFYVYVANRVQTIRKLSDPQRWEYIDTNKNPADLATRCTNPKNLLTTNWLTGPDLSKDPPSKGRYKAEEVELNEDDPEVRKEISTLATLATKRQGLGSMRFSRFSTWRSLRRAIANLLAYIQRFKQGRLSKEKEKPPSADVHRQRFASPTSQDLQRATELIILETQRDTIGKELQSMQQINMAPNSDGHNVRSKRKRAAKRSPLCQLDPFTDNAGILRVGGRLRRANLTHEEKHPVILPKHHHVSDLTVRHYHKQVHHQGRQITSGAIRQAGYWLIGSHRTVAKALGKCVTCKRLRRPTLQQSMADLPLDRTEVSPPFTNVGFDVFGPWVVCTRRTRGGVANSKRWGLVFTCLSSRAVHIEVMESMDTSSFICAIRRFFGLRGPARLLRCDRGTNFIGAKSELQDALREIDQKKVEKYMQDHGCEWHLNPPHASHFGGAWERQIGTIRRVLDAMFLELGSSQLTHELLVTLMAEVTAIVNARPIATVPSDIDKPQPLSPSALLTMKTRPLGPPPGAFTPIDLYARRRWRRVQYLAEQFWTRWKREYLQNLQVKTKWQIPSPNLRVGDIVLVKEEGASRNDWPMGRVSKAVTSEDNRVRKVEVEMVRNGKKKIYLRPVKELVLLVSEK